MGLGACLISAENWLADGSFLKTQLPEAAIPMASAAIAYRWVVVAVLAALYLLARLQQRANGAR